MGPFPPDEGGDAHVSRREQGSLRRYIEAVDSNHSSDWSIIDDFLSEDFVAHNPPVPWVSLDREGMKQASEIFRRATPGTHEITLQVAEGNLVVSHIHGRAWRDSSRRHFVPSTVRRCRSASTSMISDRLDTVIPAG